MTPLAANSREQTEARRRWLSILARATEAELHEKLGSVSPLPIATVLRGPETGLVMVRGRAGGTGAAFNLGEVTVSRCTVTASGHVGHGYVVGRQLTRAKLVAELDAGLQDSARRDTLLEAVVEPLAAIQAARRTEEAGRAAATKVQFYTMANMRS